MFFRKKIKETKKQGLYGNRYNSNKNVSAWGTLGFLEQLCLIVLPILMIFIFYIMLEMTGLIWWARLIISTSRIVVLLTLIALIINYFVDR